MNKANLSIMLAVGIMAIQCGCESKQLGKTGFLSDYSQLQKESESSLRYVNQRALKNYSSFIVDPVAVRLYSGSKSKGNLTQSQLSDLKNYMHSKIVQAVRRAGKRIVYQPKARVARIRVALTDLEKTKAINMLPQASLLGAGIGGASMEAEVIDSVTGKQIGAVVESKQGSRIPFSNFGDWTAAKSVIDSWAERFQKRLAD